MTFDLRPDSKSFRKKVVIVGGGFGGLNAAKRLAKKKADLDIVLLDRHNYHLFQPLLYQVATAGLNPGEIAVPLRTVFSKYRNVQVLLCEVKKVDLGAKQLQTDCGEIPYDYLILACGAKHSYFGNDDWEIHAPGLKTLEQATEIRRRVLLSFELAERESDPSKEKKLLTFVIVGGGPTGVELAGALGEITRFTLNHDFRHIDPRKARIILIEAGSRILTQFDPTLSARAARDLENLGVTIWTDSRVTGISADGVTLGSEQVNASTVIWAAGVRPSSLNAGLGVELDRAGRVIVGPDLSIPGYPETFVIGDQACVHENGRTLPGLAPVAMQEGRAAADAILADHFGRARKSFQLVDKGQMATIGRSRAVAETSGLKFGGIWAWLTWLLVHIYYLVGFKNRVLVLIQWFWAYLTFRRGAQLIVNKEWRSFGERTPNPSASQLPRDPVHST